MFRKKKTKKLRKRIGREATAHKVSLCSGGKISSLSGGALSALISAPTAVDDKSLQLPTKLRYDPSVIVEYPGFIEVVCTQLAGGYPSKYGNHPILGMV